jgi:acyl dehydratase
MKVSDVATRSRHVEMEDIVRFAAMTGDRNPLHLPSSTASHYPTGATHELDSYH